MADSMFDYRLGCALPAEQWANLNRVGVFEDPSLGHFVGPYPPLELMQNTTGLTDYRSFASHGADLWLALSKASPKPLAEFESILDFGCGCGRLARMFQAYPGRLSGCDVDSRHAAWCAETLTYMDAKLSRVHPPVPFADNQFEAIISISIFSHLNEASQDEFLQDLARMCRPGGVLFLSTHGERAMQRAVSEPGIKAMLDVPEDSFKRARREFAEGKHAFIAQPDGHLTTITADGVRSDRIISEPFEYGITLIPQSYVRKHWSQWFDVLGYHSGAIHDFQDIVVLTPRK